jgi:hypothetical protein
MCMWMCIVYVDVDVDVCVCLNGCVYVSESWPTTPFIYP